MIFNLLIILLIIIIAHPFGLLPFVLGKKQIPQNPFLPVILGTAILGLLSQLLLLGGRIDGFSFLVVALGAFTIRWRYRSLVQTEIENSLKSIFLWSKYSLVAYGVCLFVIAFQAAQITKINDMGMYYLQTLKWMKTYGLVKGIANLHPAYGLFSAWHSLSALFSFEDFIQWIWPQSHLSFTGINAYFVAITLGFLLWEFNNRFSLFLLLFSLFFLALAYLFLTAPSPDLPLIFYTSFMLYLALCGNEYNWEILLLACFTFWIKPPAIFAVLLGLIAYKNIWQAYLLQIKSFGKSQIITKLLTILLLPLMLISAGIYKNYIVSGHYLYPMSNQSLPALPLFAQGPAWQVPADWNKAYRTGIINWGNSDDFSKEIVKNQNHKTTYLQQLSIWLTRNGYKGWMNRLIALTWVTAFFLWLGGIIFVPKSNSFGKSSLLFFTGLNLSILFAEWILLRQYRLLLPSTLSLLGLIFLLVREPKPKFSRNYLGVSIGILYLLLCFFPMEIFKGSSRNKMVTSFGNHHFQYSLIPFHHYEDTSIFRVYCWDQPLPCQSESHHRFLQNFGYQIVPLGNQTKDGFKLIPIKRENNF